MSTDLVRFSRSTFMRGVVAGALIALGAAGTLVSTWLWIDGKTGGAHGCLQIIATGRKQPAAQGSEVWLLGARVDNQNLPLTSMGHDAGWRLTETSNRPALLATGTGSPAELSLCSAAGASEAIRLDFVSHAWSGIVDVESGGHVQSYDLFGAGPVTTRHVFVSQVGGHIDFSTVQVGLLGSASLILLAGALRWLRGLLTAQPSTADPGPSQIATSR